MRPRDIKPLRGESYWDWRLRAEKICGPQEPQKLDHALPRTWGPTGEGSPEDMK